MNENDDIRKRFEALWDDQIALESEMVEELESLHDNYDEMRGGAQYHDIDDNWTRFWPRVRKTLDGKVKEWKRIQEELFGLMGEK